MEQALENLPEFVDRVTMELARVGIQTRDLVLDHACYRTETATEYHQCKHELDELGVLLVESIVGTRPISVYKLNDPIECNSRSVGVIELPSPKEGSPYKSGWEHCEFVIQGSQGNLEQFAEMHPLDWDQRGLGKPYNKDIRLNFEEFSVKFHLDSLENVIAYENNKSD